MNKVLQLATGNHNKVIEVSRMLAPYGIDVIAPDKSLVEHIVEDGETFIDNAFIKARDLFEKTGIATLADDSGLCVDALDGRPGVYSARYLGEETSYHDKMLGIAAELSAMPEAARTARFVCALALITPHGEWTFVGECEGVIGDAPRGNNGFGYDPIFMLGDKSYAELEDYQKDEISHRGRALKELVAHLDTIKF